MEQIYETGRGSIRVRARYTFDKAANCIDITQIPPTTTIEAIVEKVIDLVKQGKLKEFMGDDYIDYNLVLAQETGRPCEDRIIGNQFERLKKSAGLPNVVFHSLRHSSTTYKLKINKGDVKATQGDTGHAQSDMVTQVYAHILDEDRKVNAQKFEMAFYANADLRGVEQRLRAESAVAEPDSEILLKQLEAKPELMDAFTKKFVEQYGEQIMNQLAKKLIGA